MEKGEGVPEPWIDALMQSARWRVRSLLLLVSCLMLWITSHVPFALTLRMLLPLLYWGFGCLAISVLGVIWLRARMRAVDRLAEVLHRGEPQVRYVHHAAVLMEHLPFGHELRVKLVTDEELSIGFWRSESASRLKRVLESRRDAALAQEREGAGAIVG